MNLFLDSSALAKRYIQEPGSDLVEEFLQSAASLGLCTLAAPEVISALCRRQREKTLSQQQYRRAKEALFADIADASIIQITDAVAVRAVELLEQCPLRAADALHIAAAAEWDADYFVSADQRQCAAARGCGLRVKELPNG